MKNVKITVTIKIQKKSGSFDYDPIACSDSSREFGEASHGEIRTNVHGLVNEARNRVIEEITKLEDVENSKPE